MEAMKPFSLETVLDYRKRLEDIAKHRLIEAKSIRKSVEKKLRDETEALVLFIDEIDKLQKEGIGITELIRYEERITRQKLNIRAIEKNLAEKINLVTREQQNLVLRSKERQIMEQLKKTQNNAWAKYLDKKEAAMLDEIASTRHQADKL